MTDLQWKSAHTGNPHAQFVVVASRFFPEGKPRCLRVQKRKPESWEFSGQTSSGCRPYINSPPARRVWWFARSDGFLNAARDGQYFFANIRIVALLEPPLNPFQPAAIDRATCRPFQCNSQISSRTFGHISNFFGFRAGSNSRDQPAAFPRVELWLAL